MTPSRDDMPDGMYEDELSRLKSQNEDLNAELQSNASKLEMSASISPHSFTAPLLLLLLLRSSFEMNKVYRSLHRQVDMWVHLKGGSRKIPKKKTWSQLLICSPSPPPLSFFSFPSPVLQATIGKKLLESNQELQNKNIELVDEMEHMREDLEQKNHDLKKENERIGKNVTLNHGLEEENQTLKEVHAVTNQPLAATPRPVCLSFFTIAQIRSTTGHTVHTGKCEIPDSH